MSLNAVLRRMKSPQPRTAFGTFRDWVSEHTEYCREVAEMGSRDWDKVEAAYRVASGADGRVGDVSDACGMGCALRQLHLRSIGEVVVVQRAFQTRYRRRIGKTSSC
jgi:hypothetical protein